MKVMEGQITWFVYMVGAIIKGRLTTGSTDTQEVMDGDLSARVLKLLLVVDTPVLVQARYSSLTSSASSLLVRYLQNQLCFCYHPRASSR